MASLRTLLFFMGTALVSGSEVKINKFYSPSEIYRLPADTKFSWENIGIPNLAGTSNLASLVPFPINGITGYLPILARGQKADCDHSGYILSQQLPNEPIYVPEAPKINSIIPEPIEEIKTLELVPEAPILPPLELPVMPLNVTEPDGHKIEETKPLTFIPDAPKLPLFSLPELPLKVYESAPIPEPFPHGSYFVESENIPELPKFVDTKPLASIPEAPVLGPFILPELPLKVSVEESKPCDLDDTFVIAPKEPEFINENKLTIPEAPKFPPFTLPEVPLKFEPAPAWIPMPDAGYYIEAPVQEAKPLAPIPEAPVLGLFTLPELPLKVSVEESKLYDQEGAFIISPKEPEFIEQNKLTIPEAPKLPPFTLPEVPLKFETAPAWIPMPDTGYYIEAPVKEAKPLPPIPEAPVLGPFTLPELPSKVSVEESKLYDQEGTFIISPKEPEFIEENKLTIPEAPKLPPFTLPEYPLKLEPSPAWIPIPDASYYIEEPVEETKPLAPIPEAPALGPFTLPELPLKVSVEESKPCDSKKSESPEAWEFIVANKVTIPEAPELTPLVLPEIPTKVLYIPELPASIENNKILESPKIEEFKPIPAAPELPPMKFQAVSEIHLTPEIPKELELKPIPEAPKLPPLVFDYNIPIISAPVEAKVIEEPTKLFFGGSEELKLTSPEFCAHTILKERVIPKFAGKETHYKVISFPVGSEQTFKAYKPGFISYMPAVNYGFPVYSS